MKKLTLILLFLFTLTHSHSQDCSERENKLFELINNFSSAYLFNTYGLIGSIVDGHAYDAYEDDMVINLLNAQKKLATDMAALINRKITDDTVMEVNRKYYLESYSKILLSFNEQIDLYFKVLKNNSKKNMDAYLAYRKKLWKDISNLLGMKDE